VRWTSDGDRLLRPLLARDLRLVWRRPGDRHGRARLLRRGDGAVPLGIGPETNLLARIAAGILWCAALFASLLSLDRLFAADYDDGALDLLLLAPGRSSWRRWPSASLTGS
jgi:heme exporter protein B